MWSPTKKQINDSNLTSFMQKTGHRTYESLHSWSVKDPDFWRKLWSHLGLIGSPGKTTVQGDGTILGSEWFPEGTLNYAENILAKMPDEALIYWAENKIKKNMTRQTVYDQTSQLIQFLKNHDIQPKDRVAALLPNRPESIIGHLATSAIGATWSSCSPDFGSQGIVDRFGQITPRILIATHEYLYNGKIIPLADKLMDLLEKLPSIEKILLVDSDPLTPIPAEIAQHPKIQLWSDVLKAYSATEITFTAFPFNHPLYVVYSSGTTGTPKCIVHGAGNVLLQHMKEHQLHCDIKPGDKVFYFTTMGWMMWNWLVSVSASGATILLYDGSPFYPKRHLLFDFAEKTSMTHFGTSAKYIDALKKIKLRPEASHNLSKLRMMMSTGSPLAPESFEYVEEHIKQDMALCSISGGTDIVSCFVLGCPIKPVHKGEIQAAGLGLEIDVVNDDGQSQLSGKGDLVCKNPFPARPLYFWDDPDHIKFKAAYFESFPPFWGHGDYVEKTKQGGFIIHGRSDAVLNPGGVRIGTAEIYRQVEQIEDVLEALVVGQKWKSDIRVILFVKLRPRKKLTLQLTDKIKQQIKENASPRHVPAKIIAINDIPRTKSGKITELAVRSLIHGEEVKNVNALANPEALDLFKELDELKT